MPLSESMTSSENAALAPAEKPLRRQEIWFAGVVILAVAFIANVGFLHRWPLAKMLLMNDVSSILAGYRQTPHLLTDGLRWWHEPWIQQGIFAFRPVSAYLYWIECWIGLHWGFLSVAWVGFVLFAVNCVLSAALTWRLTRFRACLFAAAGLAPLLRFFNPAQFNYWLAWFPVHQDLMMSAFLMAALLCFDIWHERGHRRDLFLAWAFFVLGCLSKEHVYIFPLFAASVVWLRPRGVALRRGEGLRQVGLMFLFVLLLWVYRSQIISHPRNPTAGPLTQARAFVIDASNTLGRYVLTGEGWVVGLFLLLLVLVGATLRFRRSAFAQSVWGQRLGKGYVWLPLCGLVVWCYLSLTTGSAPEALMFLFEPKELAMRGYDLLTMLVTLYGIYLLWKYRKEEPTGAAWIWMMLSYVPVLGFIGWHYMLPAWFVRVPYDVLVIKLIWIDLGRPQTRGWGLRPGLSLALYGEVTSPSESKIA